MSQTSVAAVSFGARLDIVAQMWREIIQGKVRVHSRKAGEGSDWTPQSYRFPIRLLALASHICTYEQNTQSSFRLLASLRSVDERHTR